VKAIRSRDPAVLEAYGEKWSAAEAFLKSDQEGK